MPRGKEASALGSEGCSDFDLPSLNETSAKLLFVALAFWYNSPDLEAWIFLAALRNPARSSSGTLRATLSLMTPKGDVKSHVNLVIAPGIARASENMAQIAEKLTGDISVILPIKLVEEDPALLEKATMMEQGGIVEKGSDYYSLQMQIEGDKIILASGDQLPLAMLLMLFM